jgi:putative ABC transport system permease protein
LSGLGSEGGRRSRLPLRDLVGEAGLAVVSRPVRSLVTSLGAAVGVAAFVAVLALAATVRSSVNQRFEAFAPAEVTIADARSVGNGAALATQLDRMDQLPGVLASGYVWEVRASVAGDAALVNARSSPLASQIGVVGATPSLSRADGAVFSFGGPLTRVEDQVRARVCLLGAAAVANLGLTNLDSQEAVFINGVPFVVVGVISRLRADPALLAAAIVPDQTARAVWPRQATASGQFDVSVRPSAAQAVEREAPVATDPTNPSQLQGITVVTPPLIEASITSDLSGLLRLLVAVALSVAIIGIGTAMFQAASERAFEIGLRRALGARRRDIATQFLCESALVGTIGGVVGVAAGLCAVAITCRANGWVAVIQPSVVLLAPLLGSGAGLLAGGVPAYRAALLDPVTALRL